MRNRERKHSRSCEAVIVVDSLFGTGLSRPLTGHFASWVRALSTLGVPLLAVDLPSGLDASLPEPIGVHAPCGRSITFAAPKVAHVLGSAADACGEVVVTDLGLPAGQVAGAPGSLHLSTAEELAACLDHREVASHKGDHGHVLLVAGSPGKGGAAVLAARAAVRGGAGLVSVAVPSPLLAQVDSGSVESMTLPLGWGEEGLGEGSGDEILALADGKGALGIGPGLGQGKGTVDCVRHLASTLRLPLLLDADGLNALGGELECLRERQAPTVLTPHSGEMGRLLGRSSTAVQADRLGAVREAARASGAMVLLKGHGTLIASPDGEIYINPTGNPGMATGGSGDVLTGLLLALLGQGYEVLIATVLAAYVHGLCGDLAVREGSPEGLAAGDLIDYLPRAFDELRRG